MEVIIGLGTVGCKIASKFENYKEYEVYKIEPGKKKEKKLLLLEEYQTPEEYEKNVPKTGNFFRGINSRNVTFVLCGASLPAACSLVLMERLKKKGNRISVIYVYPEVDLLGETKVLHEKVVRNVLQQYARSGALERIYLVSNVEMESMTENLTVMNYYDTLNELLCSTYHMINYFNHEKSISDTFSSPIASARISTFGFVNFETGEEKMFFPLENLRELRYYYGMSSRSLETETHLFRKIVNQVKEKKTENTRVSYGIYSTEYEHDYVYLLGHSSRIQEENT